MAMVPVYNEVNRIQVGNPVPIGGSEQARAFNESQEQLGRAIFDLGNALDNGKEDQEQFARAGRIAADKLAIARKLNAQEVMRDDSMADSTGNKVFSAVENNVTPYKQQLMQELDPRAVPYFEEASWEDLRQQTPEFIAIGVAGYARKSEAEFNEQFRLKNEQIKIDPSILPVKLLEIELAVEESNLPESLKLKTIQEKQAGAIKTAIDRYNSDGKMGKFPSFSAAQSLLTRYADKLDPDKISETNKELINDEYNTVSRVRGDITFSQGQLDYQEKKDQADTFRKLSQKFVQAKTDKEILLAEKEATELIRDNKITVEQYKEAKGVKSQVRETVDDLFEATVINQLIQEKGAISIKGKKTAVEKINAAYDKPGGITSDRHSKLLKMAEDMRDGQSRDRQEEMKAFLPMFDTYTKDSLTAIGANTGAAKQYESRAKAFRAIFIKRVLENKNDSVSGIFENVIREFDPTLSVRDIRKNTVPGLTEVQQLNERGIEGSMDKLKNDVMEANQSGNPQKIKDANHSLKKAMDRLQGGK